MLPQGLCSCKQGHADKSWVSVQRETIKRRFKNLVPDAFIKRVKTYDKDNANFSDYQTKFKQQLGFHCKLVLARGGHTNSSCNYIKKILDFLKKEFQTKRELLEEFKVILPQDPCPCY